LVVIKNSRSTSVNGINRNTIHINCCCYVPSLSDMEHATQV
jgi:hypothetical protein